MISSLQADANRPTTSAADTGAHVDAPGARVVTGQVIADRPGIGSVTVTALRVTLPVLVTT